jgi:peptidoglycan hydrolase-like protein with peptidoglycan-binding domain
MHRILHHILLAAVLAVATACVRVTPQPQPARTPRPVPLSPSWHPPKTDAPSAPAPSQPSAKPSSPAAGLSRDAIFTIQIRLDRANCSPGGIDGRWGAKTTAALAAWQEMNGLPPSGTPDPETLRRLGPPDDSLWTTFTLSPADRASLRPYPAAWPDRAALDTLGYVTLRELTAERHHLWESALEALNPGLSWPNPPDGTALRVPDVRSRPLPALSRLEISVSAKTIRAYDADGRLAAHFPCSIAANRSKRPVGQTLHVGTCADRPEYTFDPALFADDPSAAALTKRLRIPPGPNNPVGLAWIGLDLPGYGIHGTPAPEKISHTESHGCFRLTNWDAQRLLRAVRTGLPVAVLP